MSEQLARMFRRWSPVHLRSRIVECEKAYVAIFDERDRLATEMERANRALLKMSAEYSALEAERDRLRERCERWKQAAKQERNWRVFLAKLNADWRRDALEERGDDE